MSRQAFAVTACILAAGALRGAAEDSANSAVLHLPVDRNLSQRLNVAMAAVSRGDTAEALPLLDALWHDAGHALAEDGSTLRPVKARIAELLRKLPEADQRRFWERIAVADPDRESEALTGSPTRAGLAAIWRRAIGFRDRDEFALAAAAFQQAARHPAATDQERLLADVLRVDLLAEIEGPHVIADWLATVDANVHAELTIGAQQITPEAWLRSRRHMTVKTVRPDLTADRPASTPLWQHAADISPELKTGLQQSGDQLRDHGLIGLPTMRPAVIGSRIVIGTPHGLECLDAASGNLMWKSSLISGSDRATIALQQQNPVFRQSLLAMLSRQMQTNTLLGGLSHDDATVYHVEESQPLTDPSQAAVGDALAAYDVVTGKLKWRIGGAKPTKDTAWRPLRWRSDERIPSDPEAMLSVCGPPLVLGRRLYLLCESSSELLFLAIDQESLEIEWSRVIGDIRPSEGRSLVRSFSGCSLLWTGERILCATNCGVVVAVDPVTERLEWVARIPVDVWTMARSEISSADLAAEASLRSWRETSLHRVHDKAVCVSRESQAAHVLDVATGRELAVVPRGDGLLCLGVMPNVGHVSNVTEKVPHVENVRHDGVVILEPLAVRVHDVNTGELLWRTVVGEVRGRGVIAADRIVQPLSDGSLAVLDGNSGRRSPGSLASDTAWGNMIRVEDGWLAADEFGVSKFPDLASLVDQPAPPTDAAAALARATINLESGDFRAARLLLRNREDDAARQTLRQADLAELHYVPERAGDVRDSLLRRSPTRDEKGEALAALAEANLHRHRLSEALADCFSGLELGLNGERIETGAAPRRVRWDRVFQGLMADAFRRADASETQQLQRLLSARWQAARESGDPFAVQQLYQRWRALPWARQRIPEAADQVFLGTGLLARDLMLREALADRSLSTAAAAGWKLRQEWQAAGFPAIAEDVDERLLRDSPGALANNGATIRQALVATGDAERLQAHLDHGPHDPWPRGTPRVTENNDFYDEAYQFPLSVESEAVEPWDRLDVTVDRRGRTLRFCGGGLSGSWTLALPPTSSPLQVYPITYRAWGLGRLLIARIGSQLLAVTPFDEHGGPSAQVVWSLDLSPNANAAPPLRVERIASPWKPAAETYQILDPFNRDVGFVGPVRAGYLCFLEQGKLMAVETLTGRRLWERWDIAPGVVPLGDEDHIWLWSPDRKSFEVLAVADGRTVRQQTCPFSQRDVWHESGSKLWTGRNVDDMLILAGHDLGGASVLWRREFPKDSLPAVLDAHSAAVIDPRGLLHVIDLETGVTRDEPLTIDLPAAIERVIVSHDEARWYVGLSGPVDRSFDRLQIQPLQGYRRPLLNGPLYAIERARRQIVWKRDIDGSPWVLDQNRTTPVLTQIYRMPSASGGPMIGESVIRLIDKRTGKIAWQRRDINLIPNFSVEPNAELQRFEIITERTSFRFDYGPEDAE